MNDIKIFVENILAQTGMGADAIPTVRHIVLVVISIALAWIAGYIFKLFIPLANKITHKTEMKWDDALLNERVLRSACQIVPAIVIWQLLPSVFFEFPTAREVLTRLTAIYITIMATRTVVVFADSLRLLGDGQRSNRQQYLYSFIGVMKIILIFIAVIVVVAIALDKDPSTLFAGLGAASAILMLAFQDTIKGLVAGIRLTSNNMVAIGDRITVPSAGADGIVEEITLTTVKVRNFDNTIITVTPQTLVDGSFQNWKGMKENQGRKVVRKVFFDFRSLSIDDNGEVNLTSYRRHMEEWLGTQPQVLHDSIIMVHQLDATPTGLPVEFVFWLTMQDALNYEHAISEIMEHAYAEAAVFGLTIYQQFPQQ
ncbi:MAG: mechanosensitive ion channel [Prevotella sp.]|nr:mechanosensitive ion channel [Prevotella sp.]